jgi:hypothetical protein
MSGWPLSAHSPALIAAAIRLTRCCDSGLFPWRVASQSRAIWGVTVTKVARGSSCDAGTCGVVPLRAFDTAGMGMVAVAMV